MDLQQYIPMSNVKTGKNCVLTAINCITDHYGCDLSETDLFILSNGFNIKYHYDLCSIGRLSADVFSDLENESSIHPNIHRKDYEGISQEDMFHVLTEGNLILLLVDTENLRYSRIYSDNANRQHAIILNGFSDDKMYVHIVDPHLTDYSGSASIFDGVIPIEEVMAATYSYIWFDLDSRKDFPKAEIWRIAQRGFDHFMKGSEEKEYVTGLPAIKSFISDIHKLELLDDKALTAACKDINYNIKVRSINCINKFMINIINESDKDRNDQYCTKLKDNVIWHISAWEKLGLSILRIGISKRRGGLSDIRDRGIALLESQRSVYTEFANYLRELAV